MNGWYVKTASNSKKGLKSSDNHTIIIHNDRCNRNSQIIPEMSGYPGEIYISNDGDY